MSEIRQAAERLGQVYARQLKDAEDKIEFLMKHYVVSDSGFFAFADGDVWECQKGPTNGPTEAEVIGRIK
jgi:hypothetical protein